MSKKIYKTDDGHYAVAYDKDQFDVWKQANRVACFIYQDRELTKKVYHRSQLRHINQLTLITQ